MVKSSERQIMSINNKFITNNATKTCIMDSDNVVNFWFVWILTYINVVDNILWVLQIMNRVPYIKLDYSYTICRKYSLILKLAQIFLFATFEIKISIFCSQNLKENYELMTSQFYVSTFNLTSTSIFIHSLACYLNLDVVSPWPPLCLIRIRNYSRLNILENEWDRYVQI